ncbi:hypothetical protein Y1Q_0007483 [Alligator mississippiensis]|uniref:Secreted protein n=1 Tax=Alligator mississippiensis TaxID=8496 RepID=A0A151M4V4_ALLMI|nr:hypothetical protein Y1Q_0007483 [Alligator mississippiensis]
MGTFESHSIRWAWLLFSWGAPCVCTLPSSLWDHPPLPLHQASLILLDATGDPGIKENSRKRKRCGACGSSMHHQKGSLVGQSHTLAASQPLSCWITTTAASEGTQAQVLVPASPTLARIMKRNVFSCKLTEEKEHI